MNCPVCNEPATRDMVDVGIGEIPAGPWHCDACQWVESQLCPRCGAVDDCPDPTCGDEEIDETIPKYRKFA